MDGLKLKQNSIMKKLIEFILDDGEVIFVEAETTKGEQSSQKVGADIHTEKAEKSISKSLNIISPVLKILSEKANNFIDKPDEVEIELGFKFHTKAGIIIASSSAEGHIVVKLKWKKK